ncbi:MAG: aminopeptidase P N-terminal domain-containing protein [Firmicutes bacterium]|nr:aminopeptidase P N-terminal domain-containing protein [Bacillota bacterium]MDY6160003.1 aminopeptidase P N-terminal domain-containing protein [Candidatus Faecousia sp.]
MNYEARRKQMMEQMEEESLLILYSGAPAHISADAYYEFEANRHFFYLTGLRRENMVLLMRKSGGNSRITLYIEKADPTAERWTGKMVTVEEAKEISQIQDVRFGDRFDAEVNYLLNNANVSCCYFDCFRNQSTDLPDYNLSKAQQFAANYPGVQLRNLWAMASQLRMQKDKDEVTLIQQAVDVTRQALQHVMTNLKPGMKEYQAQADFEYMVHYLGAEGPSFQTIAGSGKNGCMLHYETNRETCQDGSLLLLDLGTRWQGYCSDITRTYPVNGKFTDRQRQVYEIVLRANKEVAAQAKPGMTTRELNDICKKVLAAGCMELGLIEKEEEIGKYYMHGVSHHLGIDVHDVTVEGVKLAPGSVITDEPGLYIDEWEIGIRIEDDLLITEDGCEILSAGIIKEPDEIEAFMAKR